VGVGVGVGDPTAPADADALGFSLDPLEGLSLER